jgi:hypothetical protein
VVATPFVQGRLREEKLEVNVVTECAQTGRQLRLLIDSGLDYRVLSPGAEPYIFEPHLDWQSFTAPSIVHDY